MIKVAVGALGSACRKPTPDHWRQKARGVWGRVWGQTRAPQMWNLRPSRVRPSARPEVVDDHLFPLEPESHLDGRSGRQQGRDTAGSGALFHQDGPGPPVAEKANSGGTQDVCAPQWSTQHPQAQMGTQCLSPPHSRLQQTVSSPPGCVC